MSTELVGIATMPGGMELFVILFIVLLLFGAKKLPDLAGSIGNSLKEFRKATKEAAEEEDDVGTGDGERAEGESGPSSTLHHDTDA
jgi:sec-independent protein translocase protein TatA